jgi:hypothetical protein
MSSSIATLEAAVVIGAGTASVAFLAFSLIEGNTPHAIAGLLAYAAVWVYGLYRAAYS